MPSLHKLLVLVSLAGCAAPETSVVEGTVIGGADTDIRLQPWQASLQFQVEDSFFHICGASIVQDEWIVTAAHCAEFPLEGYRIVAGTTVLDDLSTAQLRRISEIHIHPGWTQDLATGNDIAVMRLDAPLTLGDIPNRIELASTADALAGIDAPGHAATITGWGLVGTEVIQNPGFEIGREGWTLSRSNIFAAQTTAPLIGQAAGTLKLRSTSNGYIEQKVALPGGLPYVLRYWVNTDEVTKGRAYVNVLWKRRNTHLRTDTIACDGPGWRPCAETLQAPAKATHAVIRLVTTKGAGKAHFDAISLLTPQLAPNTLQAGNLEVLPDAENFGVDPAHVLIVGDPVNGGVGGCFGDSGGPLVVATASGPRLIGVTSAVFPSEGLCDPNLPSLYTRVATQRDFLDSIIAPPIQ